MKQLYQDALDHLAQISPQDSPAVKQARDYLEYQGTHDYGRLVTSVEVYINNAGPGIVVTEVMENRWVHQTVFEGK